MIVIVIVIVIGSELIMIAEVRCALLGFSSLLEVGKWFETSFNCSILPLRTCVFIIKLIECLCR